MSETIGIWTVKTAEGILKPALGIVKISVDPAPPVYDSSQASGQVSVIRTVQSFATVALALAEAKAYRTAFGSVVTFQGVACFVADVVPDHRAARTTEGGGGIATCDWFLVAPIGWVP